MVMVSLTFMRPEKLQGQCKSNMGFDNGNFGSWTTSTDSNFVAPGSNFYYKPGINHVVAAYGSTDAWLGTITKPNASCGNYMIRLGNKGVPSGISDFSKKPSVAARETKSKSSLV